MTTPTSLTSLLSLNIHIKKYNESIDKITRRKNIVCIASGVGAIGIWTYRQFAPEFLPSVAAICTHSILNHDTVYQWLGRNVSNKIFKERNLRHTGYRVMLESAFYMGVDCLVIKWLSPRFIPAVHKYIVRLRYSGIVVGSILCLAMGSLYIPKVQNRILKYMADALRNVPELAGIVQAVSGLPSNPLPTPQPSIPKISYSAVADLVTHGIGGCNDSACGICMQDSQTITQTDNTHLTKLHTCGHQFCIPCIEAWLNTGAGESIRPNKYCPMCRTPMILLADLPNQPVPPKPFARLEDHLRTIISDFRY